MNFQLVKNLFLTITLSGLFAMPSNSQPPVKNYEKEWKKVEEFNKKNLPKSALAEVKKIYALAKKDQQDAQVIKSLVYMTGLQSETRENNEMLSIKEIEKEIPAAKEPASSLLKSLLAGLYQSYFKNHRWQLYDRSKTINFKKEDIATWDAEDFHKKTSELYLQSISNEKLLQQTKLEPFDAIIIKGNVRHLRPTLYDLLAHRAIDYFENDERDIQKPAYAFEIDQASAFDPAADFIHRKFPTKDSLSLQHKALLIYQQLIAFHLNDAKHDALLDADIQRISFLKGKSTHPDKDNLYFRAVNHIANQYGKSPAAAQAWYLLAQYYNEKAESYKPFGDTTHRFARVKAKDICEEVLQQKDSSEGKINCYNLLNAINSKSLQFSIEKVNIPNLPFRALVNYRNLNTVYLRLVKADENLKKELADQYGDKYWSSILAAKAERNWQQVLPVTNDLQDHSVEIKVDALPAGEYVLVAGSDRDFKNEKTVLGARLFYVSSISYVNNSNDYFVLNRDNGQPLAKAAIQVWEQKYDYQLSKNIKVKGKLYQADQNGFFRLDKKATEESKRYENFSYYFDITHNGERLFMNDLQYDYYYNRQNSIEPKTVTLVYLFADRSIYRPGQTVYFKGIVLGMNTAAKKNAVKQDYETTLILRDANYKDIDTIKVKTNEFGSFNGKFQLPVSGLNGQFSIYTKKDGGTVGFKVEEYKRPKFFVEYEPIKGTYKVNDTIKVTGIAKAYAGNNIDGAIVKYRVVREPRFLYPWLFRRWWQPPVQQMEIAHGEVKTDKDGKFIVAFTAIPDLTLDKKFEPVFDYTVYADVTDINGETRSGEKSVSVSYKSLILVSNIPSSLPADSLKSLNIRTENMNGEFEPAKITVSITKLKEEKRLIRDRFWERPDQFVMSKEEYIKSFPYDEYDNESDFKSWEKGAAVFNKTDSVKENGKWKIENGQWATGFYMIEILTTDKNGEAVKDIQYIELFDERSKQLNQPQYLWSQAAKTIEPGETTAVQLGTSADNLFVVHQLDKKPGTGSPEPGAYSYITLNNEKKSFPFSATEADRGGYGAGWLFVKHNRFYQYNQTINVPWTNKDLSIEYASFRDKT
ncbi:MAG: alpha-2-macroglobulin, partial [Chitinophagaceae bacterium]|nr:alpha-2-macroglobulin [Chitinophagaceae bacterium]